jgi:hypothetical protein
MTLSSQKCGIYICICNIYKHHVLLYKYIQFLFANLKDFKDYKKSS